MAWDGFLFGVVDTSVLLDGVLLLRILDISLLVVGSNSITVKALGSCGCLAEEQCCVILHHPAVF